LVDWSLVDHRRFCHTDDRPRWQSLPSSRDRELNSGLKLSGTALATLGLRGQQQNHRIEGLDTMPTSTHPPARWTAEEFLRLPDDGKRHELIDGVHYVTPSPKLLHQEIVGRLHLAVGNFLAGHPTLGRVYLSRLDVVLSQWDVVEPDLLFVAGDQFDILTEDNVQGPPALVVEILSRSTRKRDEQVKRDLFERTGVREYWVVNPWDDFVTVYRRAPEGTFRCVAQLAARHHATLTTPLLPGFALPLSELFGRISSV
jgi:Uma2 family endonuclease